MSSTKSNTAALGVDNITPEQEYRKGSIMSGGGALSPVLNPHGTEQLNDSSYLPLPHWLPEKKSLLGLLLLIVVY